MTGRPIDIPIRAESGDEPVSHGNALPLLHEVRHALERLLAACEETVIDLRSIPMGPGDEARLEAELGSGEVSARLETAIGPSVAMETRFPGVWLITHYNSEDQILSRFIEVTEVPAILRSQPEDIREGLGSLSEQLQQQADE